MTQLAPLTSLRFVAAGAIVLHHSFAFEFFQGLLFARPFLGIWVSFFYVLSGFILTYVHPSLDGPAETRRFWVARVARIWPLHVATLALLVVTSLPASLRWFDTPFELTRAATNLFLLQSWVPIPTWFFSLNSVSWSISVELFFYAMFPFLLRNLDATWWWKFLLATGTVALIGLIGSLLDLAPTPTVRESRNAVSGHMFAFPPTRLPEFLLGMIVAARWQRKISLRRFVEAHATLLELAAIALLFASIHFLKGLLPIAFTVSPHLGAYLAQAGFMAVFAALILLFSFSAGRISRILSHPTFVYLGEISFGIYLIHKILLRLFHPLFTNPATMNPWLAYAIYWATLLGLSALGYHLIEKPARRWILKIYDDWTARRQTRRLARAG